MKINKTFLRWALPGTLACMTVFALAAWTGSPQQPGSASRDNRDTVPTKQRTRVTREPGDKDLDKELRQLEVAKENLKEVDWEKIQQSVESALKSVDMEKIQKQVEQSMKQVDIQKIQREVQESLAKVNFDKIQQEVTEALKKAETEVDREAIKKELAEARKEVEKELKNKDWKKEMEEVKEINMKEVQKEVEKAKEEIKKAKLDMEKEKFNFKEEMKKAHVEIEDAKVELKGYQEMIYSMEKDGLLSTKEDYSIEWKNGELNINNQKQPAEVVNKYNKYLKKDTLILKKENGDMKINHNEKHFN